MFSISIESMAGFKHKWTLQQKYFTSQEHQIRNLLYPCMINAACIRYSGVILSKGFCVQ